MTSPERAPLGAALALVVALVSLAGAPAPILMVAVGAVLTVFTALGWPALLELATPKGSAAVIAVSGLLTLVLVVLTADDAPPLRVAAISAAVGTLLAFIHQMQRRSREGLTVSLTATVAGTLVAVSASAWLIALVDAGQRGTLPLVTATAVGTAVALLIASSPLPAGPACVLGALLGGGTTFTVGLAAAEGTQALIALGAVGAVAGLASASAHVLLASLLRSREPLAALAVGAVPLATAGVIALFAEQLVPATA